MNFVGSSKAATKRVKQIVTVKTSATTYLVVSWLFIASGMTSSIALLVTELTPVKHGFTINGLHLMQRRCIQ